MKVKVNLNINDEVVVTLTPYGESILRKYYSRAYTSEAGDRLISYHYASERSYRFQLWELMKIYGCVVDDGLGQVFVDNEVGIEW